MEIKEVLSIRQLIKVVGQGISLHGSFYQPS